MPAGQRVKHTASGSLRKLLHSVFSDNFTLTIHCTLLPLPQDASTHTDMATTR